MGNENVGPIDATVAYFYWLKFLVIYRVITSEVRRGNNILIDLHDFGIKSLDYKWLLWVEYLLK